MTTMTESRRPEVEGLIKLLGSDITRFESTVFHFASQLTVDHEGDGGAKLCRYQGGQWHVQAFDTEDGGTGYWWWLDSEERFRYCNAMNDCEETVDAQLLSMAINLIATSHLCIWHFQRGNETLNHAYAVLHEG